MKGRVDQRTDRRKRTNGRTALVYLRAIIPDVDEWLRPGVRAVCEEGGRDERWSSGRGRRLQRWSIGKVDEWATGGRGRRFQRWSIGKVDEWATGGRR